MHFNMLKYSPAAAATHGRGTTAAAGRDRWMTCLNECGRKLDLKISYIPHIASAQKSNLKGCFLHGIFISDARHTTSSQSACTGNCFMYTITARTTIFTENMLLLCLSTRHLNKAFPPRLYCLIKKHK